MHADIPVLDLRAKRLEVNALLDELHRDSKRSFVKERSMKKELISETVDSLTNWLSDIWRVVYEHNVEFVHAHKCLLFVAGTIDHMISGRTSCKCAFTNLFVKVTLKNKDGKRVKSWDVNGVQNIVEVLFFIWREVFLSMLATNTNKQLRDITDMLEEIDDLLGWTALERILYGGKKCPHDIDEEEDEEDEFFDEFEDEDDYTESDFVDDTLTGPHPARHWSYRISNAMPPLRSHIQAYLASVFKLTPSLQLYRALTALSSEFSVEDTTHEELGRYLEGIATSSSDAFAAALDIWAFECFPNEIATALETHSHLLRPRDASALQRAVTVLAQHEPYKRRALEIMEKEMLDTARALRNTLLVSFSHLDAPAHRAEVLAISKMRPGAAGRQDRIEAWVDAISTPGTNAPNPMAFAAMMMGLPLVPGMDPSEDADPLGYLDLDPNDPDLEDLREEFRPRLKQRFEGWVETAPLVVGGQMQLVKVCKDILDMMPFVRAGDIVDEMVGRLADKPSKHHVCDALDALMQFVKTQRKRVHSMRTTTKHREARADANAAPVAGPSTMVPPVPPPAGPTPPLPSPHTIDLLQDVFSGPRFGGMEDVD
ncbi:uncharacterized protein B0H18DRAFT_1016536 [Fomitopsis serialis]|uniref:uncharacterized protein n=1 Tax=Fomitopsis serialis TaxID=139415 RepID=UPI0020088ED3|nr:uncharacterized protein B0H18DRAFT_1016536 [Neoantrodia serialis]KAH9922706.1 hypothetical protein B0H18DRAFT_1016536 [Neoantrodia serialis]